MQEQPPTIGPRTSGPACYELGMGLLGEVRGKKVLELGSGDGGFTEMLSARGGEVLASDLVDKWNNTNIPFQVIDLDAPWAVPENAFDLVCAIECVNFCESMGHFFDSASHALVAKGHLLITMPNCTSMRSRLKFLLNGSYRWFPHPNASLDSKEALYDQGRDPTRLSTLMLIARMHGFRTVDHRYGNPDRSFGIRLWAALIAGLDKAYRAVRKKDRFDCNRASQLTSSTVGILFEKEV